MQASQSAILDLIFRPKLRWTWHILFWLLIYPDLLLSFVGLTPRYESYQEALIQLGLDMLLVYINLYVLLPWLLLKKKALHFSNYFYYILATCISMVLILYIQENIFPTEIEEGYMVSFLSELISINILTLGFAVAIKLIKSGYQNIINIEHLKSEKLETELSYLKSQVNPHFLFNTLNSLYVQSKKNEDVSESILAFSDLLRYQIYDCQNDKIQLSKEIDYIYNYLSLEGKRRSNLKIELINNLTLSNLSIAPLLFLPLVENAVKYSQNSDASSSYIKIEISNIQKSIYFRLENSKGDIQNIKTPDSGIGLDNIKQRLNLIYPNKSELQTQDNKDNYIATLKIDLP